MVYTLRRIISRKKKNGLLKQEWKSLNNGIKRIVDGFDFFLVKIKEIKS